MPDASMTHIDVGAILQASRSGVYTDLVTRATGRTVRSQIEAQIAAGPREDVSVIDFSRVGLLDFSCADEIVATLMRQCLGTPGAERYLLFAGITDSQLDAIEHVLEHHGLALVVRFTGFGDLRLVGVVGETERLVWETVVRHQTVSAGSVARETGLEEELAADCLDLLHRRRLVVKDGVRYRAPLGAVA